MEKTALEILTTADMLLDSEEHWIKRSLREPKGLVFSYCLLGAVVYSAGGNTVDRLRNSLPLNIALEKANLAVRKLGYGDSSLSEFNDAESTTFRDVKTVLARAIEMVKRL